MPTVGRRKATPSPENRLIGEENVLRIEGVMALGPLEMEVMDAFWRNSEELVNVSDVYAILYEDRRKRKAAQMSYTTLKSTMDRLVQKGLLAKERLPDEQAFFYRSVKSKAEFEAAVIQRTLAHLMAIRPGAVLDSVQDYLHQSTETARSAGRPSVMPEEVGTDNPM